jgi:hypothetical protein
VELAQRRCGECQVFGSGVGVGGLLHGLGVHVPECPDVRRADRQVRRPRGAGLCGTWNVSMGRRKRLQSRWWPGHLLGCAAACSRPGKRCLFLDVLLLAREAG